MTVSPAIIVVGYSARALAASAAHAGFAPLSIDVFCDDDTRGVSLASVKLEGGLSEGFAPDKVASAAEMLVDAHDPIGLVYGAGFEHQPETIAAIAQRTRVFGNGADILKRAKDPIVLARVCEMNGVRHPEIALAAPGEPELWLTRGGAAPEAPISPRRKPGASLSPILIFNVALAEKASLLYSSRAKKRRKLLASACSGPRQRRRLRIDMAALRDRSTSIRRKRKRLPALSLQLRPNWISSGSTAPIFWFQQTPSGS